MKFIHQYDDNDALVEMTAPKDASLEEALDAFERFLRACTYVFDGHIVIDPEED